MTDYQLLLAFDTEDREFHRGFEAGRVWGQLNREPWEVTATVHPTNAEMMLRMGESLNRTVQSEEVADGIWMHVTFGPVPNADSC